MNSTAHIAFSAAVASVGDTSNDAATTATIPMTARLLTTLEQDIAPTSRAP